MLIKIKENIINFLIFFVSILLFLSLANYFKNYFSKLKFTSAGEKCEYVRWQGANEIGVIPMSSNIIGPIDVTSSPIYISNGKVGIGEKSPSYELQVSGEISGQQLCILDECRGSWSTGNEFWGQKGVMLYPSSSNWNIIIGTTSPDVNFRDVKFHVYLNNITDVPAFYVNIANFSDFGIQRRRDVLNNMILLREYRGQGMAFYSGSSFPNAGAQLLNSMQVGLVIVPGEKVQYEFPVYYEGEYIGTGTESYLVNYVGIGTTSPKYRLHVVGTTSVSALCFNGQDCRSSWPTMARADDLWKISNDKLYTSSTDWIVGIGTADPLGKFHVVSNRYIPVIFQMSNPNGAGAVLELRKSFTTSTNEDPYVFFSKQESVGGNYKRYGYIQGGIGGIRIVPEKVLVNVVDSETNLGRRAWRALTAINPNGGSVIVGSSSDSVTVKVFGELDSNKVISDDLSSKKIVVEGGSYKATSENPFLDLDYATAALKAYYDETNGLVFENVLAKVAPNKINFLFRETINSIPVMSLSMKYASHFVGIGTLNPQYNLQVIGTTSLDNLIVRKDITVSNNLNVSRINYSGGVPVYKTNSLCPNGGSLVLDSQCQTIDGRIIDNQYVGKLIF